MPENEDSNATVNPGYVLGQLSRAISAATEHPDEAVRQRARERIQRWVRVFQGMLSGKISVGARAPVQDVPEWATLEVVHGGFATGNLAAGGPLQAHEIELLQRIDRPSDDTSRAALNIHYLSDQGQRELREMVRSGRYRVHVAEEGALPVIAYLLEHGMTEEAQELIDSITPFFDRLRFYPAPAQRAMAPNPTVHRQSVAETVEAIRWHKQQNQVDQMMEALRIWQPLYDRTVLLFLETMQDGLPCRTYPKDWARRAQALLDKYSELRQIHTLCGKPDRPKENFARLRGYMKKCVDDPAKMNAQERSMIGHILRCYVERHGLPNSAEFTARRSAQARIASIPTHSEVAVVLMQRLQQFPKEAGIANINSVIEPITEEESARFKVPAATKIPERMALKTRRCWEAPIEQLVEHGVIPSGEVLAQVLPQITSQIRAAGITDPDLRRLYGAIYSAFRQRRSLLLLNLERQVRFEDLPWIQALNNLRQNDLNAKEQAHQVLEQVTTSTIVSFPYAILPNKLLQEIRALGTTAGLTIPIVDELAADIFMGAFTEKFPAAAKIAAQMLRGSLYERYYGLDYEQVLKLDDVQQTYGAKTSPGFAALCEELAQIKPDERWCVSRNGRIIEQSQILTTQNLAALFAALNLRTTLDGRLGDLAEQCFRWMLKRQISKSWKANLRMVKNSAYAWRQMLFFLSLLDAENRSKFVAWAQSEVSKKTFALEQPMQRVIAGLEWAISGGSFDRQGVGGALGEGRRFTGWTTGQHWVMEAALPPVSPD
jgi:hypothetical protein